MKQPEYILETSWEVCNRVGGIYAVLSTRAATMQQHFNDKTIFFGPDLKEQSDLYFKEDKRLLRGKISNVRVGRWQVPGKPIAVLVGWQHLLERKNDIYAWAWQHYGVQSHAAYGDYDTSCLYAYAAGEKMKELYDNLGKPLTIVQAHEWQTAFSLFYIRSFCPNIATVFTTHATGIGRSIAGNGKPLYDYFGGYNGDQMAEELGMVSKHSVEKQAAHTCHCFATVSDITARECKQLLEREPDIVLPNGFEKEFIPKDKAFDKARAEARKALIQYAALQTGNDIKDNAFLIGIAGRLEWKNKGIDVFLDAMNTLAGKLQAEDKDVVAFVMIPYLEQPVRVSGKLKVVFIPYYLPLQTKGLPISDKTYFDLLIGLDLTAFPSYYEPWGYTPMESVAFRVPTITTSLAGYGIWAEKQLLKAKTKPVIVIERTDSNYGEVVEQVAATALKQMRLTTKQTDALRLAAARLADKADWQHFYAYYLKAYDIAIRKSQSKTKI